ncbi:unnamed protein product [Scytosiphon promiscuus]
MCLTAEYYPRFPKTSQRAKRDLFYDAADAIFFTRTSCRAAASLVHQLPVVQALYAGSLFSTTHVYTHVLHSHAGRLAGDPRRWLHGRKSHRSPVTLLWPRQWCGRGGQRHRSYL